MNIRPKENCRWDLVALGEVMLRLDPGDRRISTARNFEVFEGGGEYNVARGLKRCFGLDTAIVTALAANSIGSLIQDLMYQGGVDQSLVRWVEYDGIGRSVRNGLNFTERGFGVRAALGCSDRGNTAASQMKPGETDWDRVFGEYGARWFHTGGIFCGLSATTPEVAIEAMQAAKRHGVIVSYDLNYRPSLWQGIGGQTQAQAVNRRIAPLVDVMIGNEEDFSVGLGFEIAVARQHGALSGPDLDSSPLDIGQFKRMIENVVKEFPFSVVATTLRRAVTATRNDWGAICFADGRFHEVTMRKDLEIYDRVGGGDSFAAGLIYGFLTGRSVQWSVECGAAHGALAMTTPGDTSMATLDDVLRLMDGKAARIAR
jgi:2-dehydro-3-deoxygluconokinase